MFTGLIEAVGEVIEVKSMSAGFRLRFASSLASEVRPGESISVNGVCLTATLVDSGEIHADIGPETARITTLGTLRRGHRVNLERPLRADGRLGGHFVLGHVDGLGTIEDLREEGDAHWLTIGFPDPLACYLIRKGSIAVDGISLTIAGLGASQFDVMIIPFTWEHSNLRTLRLRDRVNLETDVIGKYVVRAAEIGLGASEPRSD